jgi:serine/threonine-protein kinase RsbW
MSPAALEIGTGPQDLARLYLWLEEATKPYLLPPELLRAMHVALEEVVMNIVMHGQAEEPMAIMAEFTPETASLCIEDSGPAFDPTAAPSRPATLEPGGAGLKLLRHYCQDIAYERRAGRNRLTLRFSRPAAPGKPD